ncbi:unnamed protein product [Closterium sp. NIES-64]|nr:unnamed protein product [Closterium sp. NIES-64]
MYAVTVSDEGDCYRCFPPDPSIETTAQGAGEATALGASEAAALGAGEYALSGTASASASHIFTLDSGASRSFFRDRTTLTPLGRPVAVSLADPSGDPVLAHFSTVLPCPAAPSGTLSGLYLPSFSTKLVSGADLQDAGVHQFTPASQRVTHCTDARTGRHLATFTRRPGSSLYTLTTASPPVTASGQVAASSQVFAAASRSGPESAPCSCRLLSHETLLWHHRLARIRGQGHERYFVLVVDDYSRYTTVFPLRCKGDVTEINLHPTVSMPETSPALLWTRKVGDASAFRVWGSRAFVRDLSADKLSPRAAPCVFLGFPPDAPGWQFYHPTSRRVLSFQDVTFDESVPYYRLFPYRTPSLPPPPLFLVPGPPPVDPLPPQGLAPSCVSQVDAVEPVEVAGDSGAAEGAEPGGADTWGAEHVGATPGGAEPEGTTTGGAEPGGAGSGGAEPGGATCGSAEPVGAERGGATRGGVDPGGAEPEGVGLARVASGGSPVLELLGLQVLSRAGASTGVGTEATAVSPRGGPTGGATGGAGGTRAGGAAGAGAAAGGTGAVTAVSRVLLSVVSLRLALTLRVRVARTSGRGSRQRPPPIPGTHRMSLHPSTSPLRAPLPSPPESSLPALADPESDSLRAASPTVTRLLATVVTDPSFESTAASALVAELVDFAARCRLDYAASLVAESESVCPPSVGGECALGTDVLEDRQEEFQCLAAASPHLVSVLLTLEGDPDALDIPTPRSYAEAIEGPFSSQWQAAMDAEMASWKSTRTYVDAVPPPGANIVSGMWIFRVKRLPGSPPVFKARYVARGFSQRQGVDYFQTFSPTPKMTTLRVLLHIAAHRDYELHSLDFSTYFLQSSLHEEIWLRRPPGFTGTFPLGTQWSLRRPVYGLRQAPREWHDTLRTTLAALGFAPSTADPSLFLRTATSLPPFYILVYVDDLVFATADTA